MADSSDEADHGGRTRTAAAAGSIPGPSHVDSPLDQPAVRRKRFHAFRMVHKIFRRKSKRKYDTDERNATTGNLDVDAGGCRSRGKSRSTSELTAVECRPSVHPPGRSTAHSASTTSNLLSLSHDSVFAPDDDDDDDDDDTTEADASSSPPLPPTDRYNRRKLLHFTRRRFSVKGMKEELMNKLRARRDQSADDGDDDDEEDDDDPGLPHSPCSVNTSPTTAEVLGQGLLDERARAKKGSKLRSSDNSLLSMGSSETDNEMESGSGGGGIGLKLMIFDRRQNADPDLDLGPTVLLNHRAAHHRIAIKPRRTRAVPCKHRTLHQVTGGSLPMTPEDAEETTGFVAPSESLCKPTPPPQSSIQTDVAPKPESSRVTNNKSHAAECKLKHEIARYEQRMSQLSTGGQSEMDTEVGTRSTDLSSIQGEEVEVVTTSCFGFGIGRTRKTRVESSASVTKDAKKQQMMAATKQPPSSVAVGAGDEAKVNLSKVFSSRLSGRKKKADDVQKQVEWNVSKVGGGSSSSSSSCEARMSKLSTDSMTDASYNRSAETITTKSQLPADDDVNLSPRRHSCNNVDDNVVIHKAAPDRLSSEGDGCTTSTSGLASLIGETAKRKSVQHQLTKEDIDELESFLPCSRRSLPESSAAIDPSARATRRPLRFSFGSAKDVEGSAPSVSNVGGDHASKLATPSSNSSRLNDERTRSSVVRLDVAWMDASPHPTKVGNASSSSSCVTNKDLPPAVVEQEPTSFLAFDETAAVAAVPPPPLPLRRQKQCNNSGKADEPELFKVFHRRSLKLKDTDIPVVQSQSVGGVRRDSSPSPSPPSPPRTHSVEQTSSVVTVPSTDLGLNTDLQQQQPTTTALAGEIGSRKRSSIGCNVVDQNDNNSLEGTSSKRPWVDCDAVAPKAELASSDVEPVKDVSNDEDSSPIIQTNSKSTRSSKVLDLVRNFQKLQAT